MLENSLRLKNRTIWYDGDSSAHDLEFLYDKILKGDEDLSKVFVEEITPEVKKYNNLSGTVHPLGIKSDIRPIVNKWSIPEEYQQLNLRKAILLALENELDANNFTIDEIDQRIARVEVELRLWKVCEMDMLLATLIYIVNTLEDNNMVWGTGRGSSCCSYILYLIGLHDVDSVLYNLDIKEFFKNAEKFDDK